MYAISRTAPHRKIQTSILVLKIKVAHGMPRLILVFAGRTSILLVLSCRGAYMASLLAKLVFKLGSFADTALTQFDNSLTREGSKQRHQFSTCSSRFSNHKSRSFFVRLCQGAS